MPRGSMGFYGLYGLLWDAMGFHAAPRGPSPADPYVKASLMAEGRRLKKRKTSIKKNTLNPNYNEALVFDVPHESVHHVSLTIAVVDYDWWALGPLGGACRGLGVVLGDFGAFGVILEQWDVPGWMFSMRASMSSPSLG
ncbi:hypothetical protein HGM15179_021336 [Zosterops borbonicus]|uniref:C2 domain-containing protein n=1 Tax=Zosterops borbonicus TaxID=364589 RepID=A0A8K1D624_9PASS|nr:hypothetical protein HGM15179_021336 [Zosterops borbonicus]